MIRTLVLMVILLSSPAFALVTLSFECRDALLSLAYPGWEAQMDSAAAQRYIEAYPPKYTAVARFVIQNVRHVSHEEFVAALNRCTARLVDGLPQRSVLIVAAYPKSRSNEWVSTLMLEYLKNHPSDPSKKIRVILAESKDSLGAIAKRYPKAQVAFVDDAVYSGNHLTSDVLSDSGIPADRSNIVVPFVTARGVDRLSHIETDSGDVVRGSHIIYDERIPTVGELLAHQDKSLKESFEVLFGKQEEASQTLIYFDHKIPDTVSSLSFRDKNGDFTEQVLYGWVPDENGRATRQVPFIRPPDTPYAPKPYFSP